MEKSGSGDLGSSPTASDSYGAAAAAAATDSVINGPNSDSPVLASYKTLPDRDANWHLNPANNKDNCTPEQKNSTNGTVSTNAMGKVNDDPEIADSAEEKMLNEESNIVPAKDSTEVKFISENGDAKIDIETVKKTALSGMGKEELMKFANDPFWIRLRWSLFIGFWVLWFAMLGGAVAIIVMAPKCSAPQPKKWWEESPIVQLEPQDIEGRDPAGIATLFDTLREQHVSVLSLSNFVDDNGHTKDFRDVQPKAGTLADFDNIVKTAKDRNQRVVLELDPNHSSVDHPWFLRSIKREDPYTNYYVWADKKPGSNGANQPPNNWLSVNGGSAWEWNTERGQFYLHQFNKSQPDLNYNNPAVVAEFGEILAHWIERGVSGFRLGNTKYLTEDPNLRDELHSQAAASPDDYQYLNHVHTSDRLENGQVLSHWREIVANRTNNDALFALRDNINADVVAIYNEKRPVVDLPQSSIFLETANASITADDLFKGVSASIGTSGGWPSWDLNGNEKSLRRRMPREVADSITLLTLLLPGTPIFKLNDTLSAQAAFAKLAKARSVQTFLNGETETSIINGTVFVYTRMKSGNPGYLVAYQSANQPAVIDVSKLLSVPAEINVFAHSPNYSQEGGEIQEKLPSNNVPIAPKSTLVVTFVPKA